MSTHGQPQQVIVLPSTSTTTTLLKVCLLVVCSPMVMMMVFPLRQEVDQIKYQPHRIGHPHQERKPGSLQPRCHPL